MPENAEIADALERAIFEQLDDEPLDWYERFMDYYTALGQGRTLRAAYLLHNQILGEQAEHAPSYKKWREFARQFRWKKRAASHDYETNVYAQRQVAEARSLLMQASVDAVKALSLSLKSPRTRVSGAKAILDRAGLPPAKEIKHSIEGFSADELNQASEELDQWQNQMDPKSESNGSSAETQ